MRRAWLLFACCVLAVAAASPAAGASLAGRVIAVQQDPPCPGCVVTGPRDGRAVWRFLPTPVPDSVVAAIVDAARAAPTARGARLWHLMVIRDRAKVERLKVESLKAAGEGLRDRPAHRSGTDAGASRAVYREWIEGMLSAPVFLAVLADRESGDGDVALQEGGLAAGVVILTARALGYGAGYLTDLDEERAKRVFEIPDRFKLLCLIPIGVPAPMPDEVPSRPARGGPGALPEPVVHRGVQ